MNQDMYENPFSRCTARDMSYKDVLDYWCSPFQYSTFEGFNENELFTNPTPIIIEGARGSGKTMILKYLSYYCQKADAKNNDLLKYFKGKGSIGIYLRYKEDFINMLTDLEYSEHAKNCLFSYYFELLVSREILQIIDDLFNEIGELYETEKNLLINNLSVHFSGKYNQLNEFTLEIIKKIQNIDLWIKRSLYIENAEDDLFKLIESDVISSIISIIKNSIPDFENLLFIIIIDEYENAYKYQKVLNSFIKKVDNSEKITYRIGMRVQGMYTPETSVGKEPLQINRDFMKIQLIFEDNNKYQEFLISISEKRLKRSQFFSSYNYINIKELLGANENPEEEIKLVLEDVEDKEKHFDILKQEYKNPEFFNSAVSQLKCPENPLLEMLNIIWILRGKSITETKSQMQEYLEGKASKNQKYRSDYVNKYKYQLVFLLLKIYQKKVKKLYYSFSTFAFLSSGSVNDFISLCRNTFYQLDSKYYNNIENSKIIPYKMQTIGAEQTASEQLYSIQSNNENGTEMYNFIMNLGSLFSYFHTELGAKYPETNQFAFKNEVEIRNDNNVSQILRRLLKWGVIIEKRNIQSVSIGERKGKIYYINHIYAPLFNISYRIRGGYNPLLSTKLFKRMLYHPMKGEDIYNEIVNKRDFRPQGQASLFDKYDNE